MSVLPADNCNRTQLILPTNLGEGTLRDRYGRLPSSGKFLPRECATLQDNSATSIFEELRGSSSAEVQPGRQ